MSNPIYTAYSTEFIRPANATAYTAGDVVGIELAVTGATNASPIVITTATHSLTTGDVVTIASVSGNTNANGTFRVTVVSSTTFSLDGSAGNAAYTSGGTVARYSRIQKAARPGGSGLIRGWKLTKNDVDIVNATFSLAIFKGATTGGALPPAASLDNGAFTNNFYTDYNTFVHRTAGVAVAASGVGATSSYATASGLWIPFDLSGTSTDLWVQVVADAAYTPSSGEKFIVSLDIEKL